MRYTKPFNRLLTRNDVDNLAYAIWALFEIFEVNVDFIVVSFFW